MKKAFMMAAALTLAAPLALAQSSTTQTQTQTTAAVSGSYLTTIDSKFWLGSKLIGKPVYTSATNEKIGDVTNIVIDPKGEVVALVVGVGGFLGVGERDIAIRFQTIKLANDAKGNSRLTVDLSKDQLGQIPRAEMASSITY